MSRTGGSVLVMQETPSEAVELSNEAQRLARHGKLEEARVAFDRAILRAPGRASVYLDRAEVLEKLGYVSEAKADRRTARALRDALKSGRPAWTAAAAARVEDKDYKEYREYGEDVAGPGRYILNFLLAGFLGLLLTYFLRHEGWLATWISLGICVLGVIVLVASGELASGAITSVDSGG
jgi:tetratricopeptide (TPR) repeat protein